MLVNILLKFENLITIVEKRKRLLTEFKCRSYDVDCVFSASYLPPLMKNFDHENSHRHEFTSKVCPPKITLFQKTSENVFQWLFLRKFGIFWQYLGEQASDRQLPVSRICKQRQNSESVEKIVRFLAILQEWIKISYKNAKLWDQLSPNSVNWSQVKRNSRIMCQNSAIESQKLHAVDAILD